MSVPAPQSATANTDVIDSENLNRFNNIIQSLPLRTRLTISSLCLLDNISTQLLRFLIFNSNSLQVIALYTEHGTYLTTGETEIFQTLLGLFKQVRLIYNTKTALLNVYDVVPGLWFPNSPPPLILRGHEAYIITAVRKANLLTFILTTLGCFNYGFEFLQSTFLDIFCPNTLASGSSTSDQNGRFLKSQAILYLDLRTQAFIAGIRNHTNETGRLPEDKKLQLLQMIFPDDLANQLVQRRMGSNFLSGTVSTMTPSEKEFVERCDRRRESLMRYDNFKALAEAYDWNHFMKELLDYCNRNMGLIIWGKRGRGKSPLYCFDKEEFDPQVIYASGAAALDGNSSSYYLRTAPVGLTSGSGSGDGGDYNSCSDGGGGGNVEDKKKNFNDNTNDNNNGSNSNNTNNNNNNSYNGNIKVDDGDDSRNGSGNDNSSEIIDAGGIGPTLNSGGESIMPEVPIEHATVPSMSESTAVSGQDNVDKLIHDRNALLTELDVKTQHATNASVPVTSTDSNFGSPHVLPHSLVNAALVASTSAMAAGTAPNGIKRLKAKRIWSKSEEDALIAGLKEVGPSWSKILDLYGPGGRINECLKSRTQVQLKDKARNWKLHYLKTGKPLPAYLERVTGTLDKNYRLKKRVAAARQMEKALSSDNLSGMVIASSHDGARDVNLGLSNDGKPNDVNGVNQDTGKVHTQSEQSSSLFPETVIEEEKFDPNLESAI